MSNPRIRQICSSFKPTLNINMTELKAIMDGHCTDTQNIAKNIAANLPTPYINGIDFKKLNDAKEEFFIDFYERFIYRMEYIMKVGEENGYNLISFMGP